MCVYSVCVCVCVFILLAGRHTMLLQCENMYTGTGHSNTKYNINSNFVWLWLTTQLLTIITSLLTPNFTCNVLEYFKDGRPKSTCQSQNALCDIRSDI